MNLQIHKATFILVLFLFSISCHADVATVDSIEIQAAFFRQKLEQKFPNSEGAIIERAFSGFWSVSKNDEVLFFNDDQTIMINGNVIDLVKKESITSKIMEKNKLKVDVSKLPIKDAIKISSGKNTIYVFSDPHCPYCRMLDETLSLLKDIEIFIFPLPLHQSAVALSESIWCEKNQKKAWTAYMNTSTEPKTANCYNPIARNIDLAANLHIQGTPAIIFSDGTIMPGAKSLEEIVKKISSVAKK